MSPVLSLHIIHFKKRKTKALISLRRCTGWSTHVLLQTPEGRFSSIAADMIIESTLLLFLNMINHLREQSSLTPGCMTNDPYAVGMDLSLEMIGFFLVQRKPQSRKSIGSDQHVLALIQIPMFE